MYIHVCMYIGVCVCICTCTCQYIYIEAPHNGCHEPYLFLPYHKLQTGPLNPEYDQRGLSN